jgi:type I restriction enzyme S subunit
MEKTCQVWRWEDSELMKAYPAYKESSFDWIGDIPAHWNTVSLKWFCSIVNGSTPKSSIPEYWGGNIVWITPADLGELNGHKAITDSARKISETGLDNCGASLTPKGSIVLSTRAPIGHLALSETVSCTNQGCKTIVPDISRTDNSFLYYYLFAFKKILQSLGRGSTFVELSSQDLKDFVTTFPPPPEQEAIADFLDRKTTQIDDLIAKKQRQIDLLHEQRTALINQAVTKGLNPDSPMKDSGVQWLGKIPSHWDVKRIKYLGKITGGYSFKSDEFRNFDTGCRVLKISNIQTMRIDWNDESFIDESYYQKLPTFRIFQGDLVFALTRPIISTGIKAAIIQSESKILLNQRNAVFRASNDLTVTWMYYVLFNSKFVEHFESLIDATGQQPNISSIDISNIPIPMPPDDEIINITAYLEQKTKLIDQSIIQTEGQTELMQEYRTALISGAVTGKIDVREERAVHE